MKWQKKVHGTEADWDAMFKLPNLRQKIGTKENELELCREEWLGCLNSHALPLPRIVVRSSMEFEALEGLAEMGYEGILIFCTGNSDCDGELVKSATNLKLKARKIGDVVADHGCWSRRLIKKLSKKLAKLLASS